MIKEIMFSVWGALWVAIDKFVEALDAMSGKEFLKFAGKVFVYGLSVVGWVAIFFGLYIVGWAAL